MRIAKPASAAVLLLAFSTACTFVAEAPSRPPAPETPDMDAYWAKHNEYFIKGNLDAALDNLTEDFVLVQAFKEPVKGREKLRDAMEQSLSSSEIKQLSMDSTETLNAGSWLVDMGTFSETATSKEPPGQEFTLEGSYFAVLRKDDSGAWKVQRFVPVPSKPYPPEMMAGEKAGDQTP